MIATYTKINEWLNNLSQSGLDSIEINLISKKFPPEIEDAQEEELYTNGLVFILNKRVHTTQNAVMPNLATLGLPYVVPAEKANAKSNIATIGFGVNL